MSKQIAADGFEIARLSRDSADKFDSDEQAMQAAAFAISAFIKGIDLALIDPDEARRERKLIIKSLAASLASQATADK